MDVSNSQQLDGSPITSATLNKHKVAAVQALLLITGMGAPIVSVAVFLREGWTPLFWLAVMASVVFGLLWLLLKRGHIRVATSGLVLVLLIVSTGGTAYDGSVRSAAAFVMLASMVIAGSFLSRAAALGVGVYVLASLGLLNWLEQNGTLTPSLHPVGFTVWVLQAVVVAAILISSLYGRHRLMQLVKEQEAASLSAQVAQASQRASQTRFEALFRGNPLACLVQHLPTLGVVDVNETFCQLFGHTRASLIENGLPRVWVDPVQHQAFRDAIGQRQRVDGMHATGLRSYGSQFDGLVYAEIIEQTPDPLLMIMVLDVSREAASRRALEKSQLRFTKAFEFSPLGMMITRESDKKIVEINRANQAVLGRNRADMIGKTPDAIGMWHSEEEHLALVEKIQQTPRLEGYEMQLRTQPGGAVPVRLWSEPMELDEEDCRLTFMLDIAEEKRREAMLIDVAQGVSGDTGEAFFHSLARHLVTAVGATGIVIAERNQTPYLNSLALISQGLPQPNQHVEPSQAVYERLLVSRRLVFVDKPTEADLGRDTPFKPAEVKALAGMALRDADGSAIGVLMVTWSQPIVAGSEVRSMMSIFGSRCEAELIRLRRDREIGRLYETLEQRVKVRTAQLEYLNRELDTFAYSVSHDLKSPLRSIDGFMHLLREQLQDRLTPQDEEMMGKINGSVSRMGSLIKDLLSLARVSQGQLQRMQVNLTDLAEGVIRQEQHRDPTHSVELAIGPVLAADCDPRMAEIVLENLLGNAWKYSHKQAHPRIELGQMPQQPGFAPVFYVRDNGAGFDMARVDRLFKPFTRLHTASEFEGSGIGLATVRRILERHGGFIHAEGAVEGGARFEFSFGLGDID
jgi:PAS domain S-box-containing protein